MRERLVALFKGQIDQVTEDFRIATEDGGLHASKAETLLRKVLENFVNNRDRMPCDTYPATGLPMGSGVIGESF